ncbi:hypothetical protein HCN44_007031 [Aphidius gifuensis]|uniref:Uncharacterized protein n=1 Tax=Aphidius gifuensis TaxID=684658 RepID=A0A835CTF2_APHGI|nr:uncharacterized protein LOC122849607 [Aphidius gifuensis]KAF7995924.1 hypothetical protein HCN44_007031 [Aphidius gifuensis]
MIIQTERLHFCCAPKTAVLIIGILSAGSCIHGILGIASLVYTLSFDDNQYYHYSYDYLMIYSILIGTCVYLWLSLAASLGLIYGVQKKRSNYVFPFVCLTLSGFVTSIAVFFGLSSYFLLAVPLDVAVFALLFMIGCLYLQAYCFIIVKGFYYNLLKNEFEQSPKLVYTYPTVEVPTTTSIPPPSSDDQTNK